MALLLCFCNHGDVLFLYIVHLSGLYGCISSLKMVNGKKSMNSMFVSSQFYLPLMLFSHRTSFKSMHNCWNCECHHASNESLALGVMMLSTGSSRCEMNGGRRRNHFH